MSLVGFTQAFVLAVLAVSTAGQIGLFASALVELRRIRSLDRFRLWRRAMSSPFAPRVTMLVPAYNEGVTIVAAVRGLLTLTYPNLEIVVVNDGSSDDTMEQLVSGFELVPVLPVYRRVIATEPVREMYRSSIDPRLLVLDKHNGGKADALNVAVNVASGELVCAIDADTLVAPDALHQLVAPFMADDDVVAAGGTIRLVNHAESVAGRIGRVRAPRNLLVGAQAVEYSRAFLVGRLAWNPLGGNLIISGAFGLFRRSALLEVGGYLHGSIGEDMELVVRLRRHGYEQRRPAKVVFVPDPVAYTEAPESWRFLARQRNRWFRGLLDVLLRHRTMIGNPRYGTAGMLAMPYFVIVEALAPVLELAGLVTIGVGVLTGWLPPSGLTGVAIVYLVGLCATIAVLVLDEVVFHSYDCTRDRLLILGHAIFEHVVFRPVTAVWRVWGIWLFLGGSTDWGTQRRRGFVSAAAGDELQPQAASS